nr:MAG TPA: apolipoprotein [Caudoviricetes sp.]
MASISIENGKRIEELLEVSQIHADSYFLVSETDLTRKITLQNLRNAFNGDTATENLNNVYYSVEKINELLDHIYDEIDKINTKIDNMQDQIDNIYNDLGADLSEFKKYVEQIYEELKLADQNLNTKIDNVKIELNQKIEDTKRQLQTEINNVREELTNKIEDVNRKLDARLKIVENKLRNVTDIQIGTSVPSTLPSGVIYLQYF